MDDDGGPLFQQVAAQVEAAILDGSLAEEDRAPSTNELAAFHRINPATAAKGLGQLVADGLLYKRRGIGMFVTTGARQRVLERRRKEFATSYVEPMVAEANRIGLSGDDLRDLIADVETGIR